MSRTALRMYLDHLEEKKRNESIHHQAALYDWYERKRDMEKQAEVNKQKELDAKKAFARESFFANLDTRRIDLQHSIALYPLTHNVCVDWWKYCGCNRILGYIAASGMDHHNLLSYRTSLDVSAKYCPINNERFSAYNNIGSMCNDANPIYQLRVMAAVSLFFQYYSIDGLDTQKLNQLTSNRASKVSHVMMALVGQFALLGDRSAAQPFELFWSLSKQQRDKLITLDTTEGELFRQFCPNDASFADDLIRMRELFFLCKYKIPANETHHAELHQTSELTEGLIPSLSIEEYIHDQFNDETKKIIQLGISGLIKIMDDKAVDSDDLLTTMKLQEEFPLVYATCLSLMLLARINPSCFKDIAECVADPDRIRLPVSSVNLESAIGLARFFPEMSHLENHEVWIANSHCNMLKSQPSTAKRDTSDANSIPQHGKGSIIPDANIFVAYEQMINQGSRLHDLNVECDLMPFTASYKSDLHNLDAEDKALLEELFDLPQGHVNVIEANGETNV